MPANRCTISYVSWLNHNMSIHSRPTFPSEGMPLPTPCCLLKPSASSQFQRLWKLLHLAPKGFLSMCAHFLDNFPFLVDYEFSKRTPEFYMSQYLHCWLHSLLSEMGTVFYGQKKHITCLLALTFQGIINFKDVSACRELLMSEFWVSAILPVAHCERSEDGVLILGAERNFLNMSTTTRIPHHFLTKGHWQFMYHIPMNSNGLMTIKEDC